MKPSEFLKEDAYDSKEYNDEVGMVKSDIHTIVRVMTHLCKELRDDENLPEWVQSKISRAKGMLVDAMDYMISQHEQGIQPTMHGEVAEDASGGGTSSGGMATSMGGGGDGFGLSPFMKASDLPKRAKVKK